MVQLRDRLLPFLKTALDSRSRMEESVRATAFGILSDLLVICSSGQRTGALRPLAMKLDADIKKFYARQFRRQLQRGFPGLALPPRLAPSQSCPVVRPCRLVLVLKQLVSAPARPDHGSRRQALRSGAP